jgi:hypothetical protein
MQPSQLTVRCPDCGAEIKVDVATGQVVFHRKSTQKSATKNFDELLSGLDTDKARADEIFAQEVAALKDRDRLMEAKFREALQRVDEEEDPDKPPARPWDFD